MTTQLALCHLLFTLFSFIIPTFSFHLSQSPNIVVAKDGSGNYATVQEALDVASKRAGNDRFAISIKTGVYEEYLHIDGNNITLIGDGMEKTIITDNRSSKGGFKTYDSSTVAVTGAQFIASGITFRNTAGPKSEQAVALLSSSERLAFYRCGFEGYQDTLYVYSGTQFYKECNLKGTVDFIFGNAAVVFQDCTICVRRPINGQKNAVTAQGRVDANGKTGIVIHNSRVITDADLAPMLSSFQTFLGRPWKEYSRTIFMKTYLDSLVDPAGWLDWNDTKLYEDTLYYREYKNTGPGASTSRRVKWKGYGVITDDAEASTFTVDNFIDGISWLPSTGIPFNSGL